MLQGEMGVVLQTRCAGGGFKPPTSVAVRGRGGDRTAKRQGETCQVRAVESNVSESLKTCREYKDGVKTGVGKQSRDESEGHLLTDRPEAGSGMIRALYAGTGSVACLQPDDGIHFVKRDRRRERLQPGQCDRLLAVKVLV